MNKRILEINDSFLGYNATLAPMKRGKFESFITKKINSNYGVLELRDWILNLVTNGAITYNSDDLKMIYGICEDPATPNIYYVVKKMEYDFAEYLINNGFNDEDRVVSFIAEENQKAADEEKRAADEKKRAADELKKTIEENRKFKDWLENEAINYPDGDKKELQTRIFEDIYGEIHQFNRKTIVLIDHFDNPRCKKMLQDYLTTTNKGSRKYFECVTGLKLPKTNKETLAYIDGITSSDFIGMVEYKPRKKRTAKEKNQEIFYILKRGDKGELDFVPTEGESLKKYGLNLFIHVVGSECVISSVDCGMRLVGGGTKTKAMEELKKAVDKIGKDKIYNLICDCGNKFGWSPRSYNK